MKKIFIFAFCLFSFVISAAGCSRAIRSPVAPSHASTSPADTLRIILDPPPVALNPRAPSDITSQRIQELLFRGLTRLDKELIPRPDLASAWEISTSGKVWSFPIQPGLKDHSGRLITASDIRDCLENYRVGKPSTYFPTALPSWESTTSEGSTVFIRLKKPDPYLARNLSTMRYFRTNAKAPPCSEPLTGEPLIGSGPYRAARWDLSPEGNFLLLPFEGFDSKEPRKKIELIFLQDDNTKALKLLGGEADAIHMALSPSKLRWIQKKYADRFDVLERDGAATSYLAFNLGDPILGRKNVRRAIALAIDRNSVVQNKNGGVTTLAPSLLPPFLPESFPIDFKFDRARAEALLDLENLPRKKDGFRFALHYKSTPNQDGIEIALMIQEMLREIGIKVVISVVEPAVFFSSLKGGNFQLYSSRWIGISDGSILNTTLHSGQRLNRVGYHDPEMDRLLDLAATTMDLEQRKEIMREIQLKISEDLPYLPLWNWDVATILRKNIRGLTSDKISASASLEPLTHLR